LLFARQLEIRQPGDALDIGDGESGHSAMLTPRQVKGQKAKVTGEVKGIGVGARCKANV
jgi:hypothetical protein